MATNVSAVKVPPVSAPKPAPAADKAARPAPSVKPVASGPAPARRGGLPLIGRLSVNSQMRVLITLMIAFLLVAVACVVLNTRQATQNTQYLSTSTEMQMLSQRISNAAQQAVDGIPTAFPQLKQSHDQFVANLRLLEKGGARLGVTVTASPGQIQPALQALDKMWVPVQKNIELILAQEKNLIELRRREETIGRSAPQLALLAQELFISARDAGERYGTRTFTQQLYHDTANFDFINALRLLSTERPDPQLALALGNNTRNYLRTLKALQGEGTVTGVLPIQDADVRSRAQDLDKAFTPFAASVQAILDNMRPLASAKQAARDIFGASEALLKSPIELVDMYTQQEEGGMQRYYVWGAIAATLIALLGLLLLGKVYIDDSMRRAVESEQVNRTNQEAILRLLDEISDLGQGDLTVRPKVTEEITGAIADSINYAVGEMRRLVSGITSAAQQVTTATQEAQAVSSQLLQAAQKQSTEIQGTGQAVTQMAQSMTEASRNANDSAKVADTSVQAAQKGAHAVQNAIKGMNEIRDQIQETAKRIKRLGESSQEISEIVQLISDITEQTNVLALNAAIQAASAGEAGRGFTVVAEEVQRLAERSGEATKHISAIVKSIQRDTQDAVEAMERSTQGVVEGTKTADEADRALREIGQVSNRLAELIRSISEMTQKQAGAATKVASNMKEILGVTQATMDGTRKTAAQTAKLTELADGLKQSVAGFKV
jgi:twitching motility protein PilJ